MRPAQLLPVATALLLFISGSLSFDALEPEEELKLLNLFEPFQEVRNLLATVDYDALSPEELESLEKLKDIFEEVQNVGLENFGGDGSKFGKGSNLKGHKLDPDAKRNVTELITSKGYSCEDHIAQTEDGYLLSLQRIGASNSSTAKAQNNSIVVLLQHGLLDSSSTWVINLANNSLGFLLADEGYDVWMSNSRGNTYSHANIHHNPRYREFWDFSWDEMAKYDLPATIDYIASVTNVSQIYYVGHSQGTLIGFTGFSQNATLASYIKRFFALAPISHAKHIKGPIRFLVPFHQIAYKILNLIGYNEVFGDTSFLGRSVCRISPLFCETLTFAVAGIDVWGYNRTRSDVYYSHFPAGTSLRDVNHWAQLIHSGDTQMYDFGYFDNKKHYHQHNAPIYNITGLQVPVALFSGTHDWLADPKDVETLRSDINHTIVYDDTIDRFDHLDFVWGTTAHRKVYREIIHQIKKNERLV